MRVTVLREIPEDPELSESWNTLVLAMENPEVFFTYQWALAASRGFQGRLATMLFLVHDSGQLAGVAALALDPRSPRAVFFLTASTADYCDVVSKPADRGKVLRAVLEEIKRLGLSDLVLANVPANSATLQELAAVAGSNRFYVTSRPAYNCGVVHLQDEQQREALLQALAGKAREKRALKRLSSLGAVRVIHLTEPEQVGPSLESIVSAQISRFLASNRVSPLVGDERRAFLRHLSELLSHSGWLKISQLEIDGRPVAWNYGFRFGGSWFWYLPTFQMEYEHVSPGSCLLRLLVEEGARDSSLQWLDLGLGDEPYKERFANSIRQTRYVHLSRGLARHIVSLGREWLSGTAARFPRFGDRLRNVRDRARTTSHRLREMGLGGALRYSARRFTRPIASQDQVLLFEAPKLAVSETGTPLHPLTREHLVEASILNAADPNTLSYLMRCAKRLGKSDESGFVMLDEQNRPVHFLWTGTYEGFRLAEIDHALAPVAPGAVMIFDCWTPAASRGHGYYAAAIRQAAVEIQREGKAAWIFSGATNQASLSGILKAGFQHRYTLVRRRRFGASTVSRHNARAATIPKSVAPAASESAEKIAVNG